MSVDEDECSTAKIQRVVCSIGVVVSLISFVVMTRRNVRTSSNAYLAAIELSSVCFFVSTIYAGFRHTMPLAPRFNIYWIVLPLMKLVVDVSACCSSWLTVLFVLHSYIVAHRSARDNYRTVRYPLRVIGVVLFVCTLWCLPSVLEYHVRIMSDDNETIQVLQCHLSDNNIYRAIKYFLTPGLMVIVPLSILLCLIGCLIFAAVSAAHHRHRRITATFDDLGPTHTDKLVVTGETVAQRRETNSVILAILIGSWHLVGVAAPAGIYVVNSIREGLYDDEGLVYCQADLSAYFVSIGNFFLYVVFVPKYRETLLSPLCGMGRMIIEHPVYEEMAVSF